MSGTSIDELPPEYEPYKKQIAILRSYGYGIVEKPVYEQVIDWLETHNGRKPRGNFGRKFKRSDLTQAEQEEVRLYARWHKTLEFKALQACIGIPIDELPPEYEPYKEQIATLRRYEQMRKDNSIKARMKKSVKERIKNNNDTRQEIHAIEKELKAKQQGKDDDERKS